MRQYRELKKRYQGSLLLFRLGDFYETFYEDAVKASKALGIALTSRGKEGGNPIPLAGIPHHSADQYIDRLVASGYKVAICEQMEDPSKAKGLVKRDVVRVVTPGTVLSERLLSGNKPNYLAALNPGDKSWGFSVVDLSTGEFLVTEIDASQIGEEIERLQPTELLLPHWILEREEEMVSLQIPENVALEGRDAWLFDDENAGDILCRHFNSTTLDGFGLRSMRLAVGAAGAALQYLLDTQKGPLRHIRGIRVYHISEFMHVDRHTRRNLELVESMDREDADTTLYSVMNKTKTRMGARLLHRWILQPLVDVEHIVLRLDAVEKWVGKIPEREAVREQLSKTSDIERLAGRVGYGSALPRDLLALATSLDVIGSLKPLLRMFTDSLVSSIDSQLDGEAPLVERIRAAIAMDAPATIRAGGYIRVGYDEELDELRSGSKNGRQWLASLQQQERDRTGIPSLKIGYNRVFGYYIEVTKSHLSKVPDDYIRKQTLTNAERFFTAALKEKESLILGAEERSLSREQELFRALLSWLEEQLETIIRIAQAFAKLDVITSLAQLAQESGYCRPRVDTSARIVICKGRHPVVERLNTEPFVPNDVLLDDESHQIILLTGPNMAGKSTYLRQTGLIVLMAQMGSFVPAESAEIGLVDRVFTRVGASDRLARGQSTFLVEMIETANILHHATSRSLVLLDEIGRGTSTYDGLSIAWAVAERLHHGPGGRPWTLFATHYHELTVLERMLPRIKNYNIAVQREGRRVLFLHKIEPGAANSSYGIEVARLAAIPEDVLKRAGEILIDLENGVQHQRVISADLPREPAQLELFTPVHDPIREKLNSLALEHMTPIQALNVLYELKHDSQRESG